MPKLPENALDQKRHSRKSARQQTARIDKGTQIDRVNDACHKTQQYPAQIVCQLVTVRLHRRSLFSSDIPRMHPSGITALSRNIERDRTQNPLPCLNHVRVKLFVIRLDLLLVFAYAYKYGQRIEKKGVGAKIFQKNLKSCFPHTIQLVKIPDSH